MAVEVTKRLYPVDASFIQAQMLGLSQCLFMQRLRLLLKHCISALGVEATSRLLQLPQPICHCLVSDPMDFPDDEGQDEEVELSVSDEQRKAAVAMYQRGIKPQYIVGLFDIINPKVVESWGDWCRRPKAEAERHTTLRGQARKLLESGQPAKSIRLRLEMDERAYCDLMGIAVGAVFSRTHYDAVLKQGGSPQVASAKTGVPIHVVSAWLRGRRVPPKPLVDSDSEAPAADKKAAISCYYQTGNALLAGGRKFTPQTVERWVAKYQQAVDS